MPRYTWCQQPGCGTPGGRSARSGTSPRWPAQRADLLFGWMAKAMLYAGPAAWLAGRPAAYYQVAVPDPRSRLDRAANRVPGAGVLVLSSDAAAAQQRFFPRRPHRLVYPAADLARFAPGNVPPPTDARDRLRLPPGRKLVGLIGRLQTWKGVHVLLDALPRIREHHPDAFGVIVGGEHPLEANYSRAVRAQATRLGLDEHVLFAGHQTDVPLWMNALDVVVHASDDEPFGIVVIEAMALGKPLVAGDGGGPREILTPGVDGLLAGFGDDRALADRVVELLDDPIRAASMGEAARLRTADFGAPAYAANVVAAMRSLCVAAPFRLRGSALPGPSA